MTSGRGGLGFGVSTVAVPAVLAVLATAVLVALTIVPSVGVAKAPHGGWAMTSLDAIPAFVAGEAVDVAFTVRAHGRTPIEITDGGVGIEVLAGDAAAWSHAGAGRSFHGAEPGESPGRYVATVVIDEPGTYAWRVHQGWYGPQDLGTIDVAPAGSSSGGPVPARPALLALAAALVLVAVVDPLPRWRGRRRPAVAR